MNCDHKNTTYTTGVEPYLRLSATPGDMWMEYRETSREVCAECGAYRDNFVLQDDTGRYRTLTPSQVKAIDPNFFELP